MLRSKVTLLFLAFAFAIFAVAGTAMALTTDGSGSTSPSPTIASDKADYAPGELVTLTGGNWQPGESVNIKVNDDVGQTWTHNVDVTADANGDISDSFSLPDWFVATYTVTATGAQSGVATTSFTDSNFQANSNLPAGMETSVSWIKYSNTSCTKGAGTPGANVLASDTETISGTSNTNLTDVDPGQSIRMTAASNPTSPANNTRAFEKWTNSSGTTISSTTDSGCIAGSSGPAVRFTVNYTNDVPAANNQTVSTNVNTSKLITLSATDANNDNLSYTVTSLPADGKLYKGNSTSGSDEIKTTNLPANLAGATVNYVPNAGFSGTNTFGFRASDGTANSNTATVTINVAPACTAPAITQQPANQSITYGANASFTAAASGTAGSVKWQVSPDGINNWTDVANATSATLSLTKPSVAQSGNHYRAVFTNACGSATTNGSATLTVAQKELTVNGLSAQDKVYNGNTNATITGTGSLVGVISPDVVTLTGTPTGTFASKNVNPVGSPQTVTVSGLSLTGAQAGNYSLTQPTLSANINQRLVTATITAADKDYDGNTNATITDCSLNAQNGDAGVVTGETNVGCSASNAQFDTASAGQNKTVTADVTLTGTGAANYKLTSNSATDTSVEIRKVQLTPSVTVNNKTYDGITNATIATRTFANQSAIVGTDDVSLTGGSAQFATASADTHKLVNVTGLSLGGAQATNYQLSSTSTTAYADISQRLVTATITADDKDYDGNTNATASCTLDSQNGDAGVVTGETNVGCSASNAQFDTASAGQNKTVTADVTLTGTGAANYKLTSNSATDTSVEIRKVQLTVKADNKLKTYDGNPFPTANFTSQITGFVNSENASVVSGTVTYGGTAVGAIDANSYTIVPDVSGLSATNYTFTPANGTLKIDQAALTVTVDNKSKYYGDPNPAPLTGTLTGVVNSDNITATYSTQATQFSKAGPYPITATLLDPNNRLGNYYVTNNPGTLTILSLTTKGFFAPVDMSGTAIAWNTVKGGSTVPVKFELFKNASDPSTELRDTSYVDKFAFVKVTCTAGADDAIEELTTATGQTTLRYDTTGDQFVYNWATPKVSTTTCYKLTMYGADGSSQISAYFKFNK